MENLIPYFDEIIIIPCGPRPDKSTVAEIEPVHRAEMTKLTFSGLPKVRVGLFDVRENKFTRTWALQKMFAPRGEVWHLIGADWTVGGEFGESKIHKVWERGAELWETLNFVITDRDGYLYRPEGLPPHHRFFKLGVNGSSSEIKKLIRDGRPIGNLVSPEVGDYISRHGLYRRKEANMK